jgi:hypothetical protein
VSRRGLALVALSLAIAAAALGTLAYEALLEDGDLDVTAPGSVEPGDGPAESGGLVAIDGGLWALRRDAGDDAALPGDDLLSLPYVSGSTPPRSAGGVVAHDPGRAWSGINLYTSGHGPEALLVDMEGSVLHRWAYDRDRVWPHLADHAPDRAGRYFRRVHLYPDGDLLAIYGYVGLIRLDRNSNLEWSHQGWNHHDLDVDEHGRIVVLGTERRVVPELGPEPIAADNVTVLSADGVVVDRVDIAECLLRSEPKLAERARNLDSSDPFHANTVDVLDGSSGGRSPAFSRGNWLVSLRNLGVIGVIDPAARRFVWALWGPWSMQHEPVLLADGNMLLFDNRTVPAELRDEGSSRVIEFDPLERRIVWELEGTDELPLYSSLCGAAARLPNGNTLVTESDYGRVLEVSPDFEVVWEFENPHRAGADGEWVALIPEMVRLPRDYPAWL